MPSQAPNKSEPCIGLIILIDLKATFDISFFEYKIKWLVIEKENKHSIIVHTKSRDKY